MWTSMDMPITKGLSRTFCRNRLITLIVLAILTLSFLPYYIMPGHAASYLPGVKPGSTVSYNNVTAFWHNNVTGVTPPPFLSDFLNVASMSLAVKAVTGTNVTASQTFTFTNGTAPRIFTLSGNVADGSGNLTYWILSSGLTGGSPIYNTLNSPTINWTSTEFYAGALRTVDNFIISESSSGVTASLNWAWDQSTGILVTFVSSYSYSSTTGSFDGHSSVQITSTNLWSSAPVNFQVFSGGSNETVNAGSSVADSIYVISINGTSGTVSLSAKAAPAGPGLILNPTTVVLPGGGNVSSTLTITTTTSTLPGSYVVTVNATSGSLSRTTQIKLTVKPANSPDFTITATPFFSQVQVLQYANYTITVASLHGFNSTVTLGVSTGGATVSLQPPTIKGSGTAVLRAIANSIGNYTIEVIATSGYLYHTVTMSLGVIPQTISSGGLAIDGSAILGCVHSTNSCTTTFSTSHPNDVIIAYTMETLDLQTSCTFSVSDTAGLSWSMRASVSGRNDGTTGSNRDQLAEFWAASPGILSSDAVTESISGCASIDYGGEYNGLMVFGVTGANLNSPFDTNPATPNTAFGYSSSPSVQISTSQSEDMIIGVALQSSFPTISAGPGFNVISSDWLYSVSEYEFTGSPTTNFPVSFSDTTTWYWETIGDAIRPASTIPEFGISANPSNLAVSPSRPVTSLITLTSLNSFKGTVDLSVTPPAPGFSVTLQPPSLILSANSTAQATITVNQLTNTTTSFDLYVNGTSGSLSRSVRVHVTGAQLLSPSFNISALAIITVQAGNSYTDPVYFTSVNNFTGTVTLTASIVPSFADSPTASLYPLQVSLSPGLFAVSTLTIATTSSTTTGSYNYTVTGTVSSASGIIRVTFVGQLVVQAPPEPDFSISAIPSSLRTTAGFSASSEIDVFPGGTIGGNLTVFLSVLVPRVNGLTAGLSPNTIFLSTTSYGGFSTLTVNTASTTLAGNYTLVVVGKGGIYTHNVTVTLQVLPPPVLTLTPTSGLVGAKILVQGSNFPVRGATEMLMTFDDQLVGLEFTSTGNFSFTFDVPVAQPGPHTVKAEDTFYTGTGEVIITGTAAFQVLAAPISLSVNLATGTIYFPGDNATFYAYVTQNGQPAAITGLQVTLQIIKPNGATQTITMTSTSTGVYKATYLVPSRTSLGTYAVTVRATSASTGSVSSLTSFEVKPTWLQANGANLAAGISVVGLVGLVGLAWQQGIFKRKKEEKPVDWNNWKQD